MRKLSCIQAAHYIVALLLLCIAFIMFNLGMDYVNFNIGLHPGIALPIALASFIGACYFADFYG